MEQYLPLSRGLNALVDADDYVAASEYKWTASVHGYAYRALNRSAAPFTEYLHHFIIGTPADGLVVDHINGNTLDNRRANLRVITKQVNSRNRYAPQTNTSGVLGVSHRNGKWRAYLTIDGKQVWLGTHETKADASEARRLGELMLWGENSLAHGHA